MDKEIFFEYAPDQEDASELVGQVITAAEIIEFNDTNENQIISGIILTFNSGKELLFQDNGQWFVKEKNTKGDE